MFGRIMEIAVTLVAMASCWIFFWGWVRSYIDLCKAMKKLDDAGM